MNRKIRKMMKYFVLGGIFAVFLSGHFLYLYGFQSITRTSTPVHINNIVLDEIHDYDKKYIIRTPLSHSGNLPVIVLLHGDLVDAKSMNIIATELVKQGFMTVAFNIDHTYFSIFEIDAIVNDILTHPDADPTKIGIIGHSHGAHFAYWYARLRSNIIKGVISANLGAFRTIHEDFHDYYNYFIDTAYDWSFPDFYENYTNPITDDNPKNFLIITDRYEPIRFEQEIDDGIVAWESDQPEFRGSFENGTAREINTDYKLFFHGSGLYNPLAIKKQIDWMNQALDITDQNVDIRPISFRIYSAFVVIGIIIGLGFTFLYYILSLMPIQFSWIKNKLHLRKKEKTQDEGMEIPPVLSLITNSKYPSEKLRLDKRSLRQFTQVYDLSQYFRIIIIAVLGIHFLLYLVESIGTNILFYYTQGGSEGLFQKIIDFNHGLSDTLFGSPLSFQFMYIWIIFIFFFHQLQIKDPPIKRAKLTILDAPNILILIVEFVFIIWAFGHLMMFHWLGFNFLSSSINAILRFGIIFYINVLVTEFVTFQTSKPDKIYRNILIGAFFFIWLLYLPVALPTVTVINLVHQYAIYYILPYFFVTIVAFIMLIQNKIDLVTVTMINFFFLLFWKYNVHYFVFF